MKILELGNYVLPAYAGMILAEQGHVVEKWTNGRDPILGLHRGDELWAWINADKTIVDRHPREAADGGFDVVLDNFRPATLAKWGVRPAEIARQHGLVWVSMRSEVGQRSFDLIAQARSWMEYGPWTPFWIGDTAGGLWMAFKALAMAGRPGHYVLGQATVMQKLVEGELIVDVKREPGVIPWETETYRQEGSEVIVDYKGERYREPIRDRAWKLEHLWHDKGRLRV